MMGGIKGAGQNDGDAGGGADVCNEWSRETLLRKGHLNKDVKGDRCQAILLSRTNVPRR